MLIGKSFIFALTLTTSPNGGVHSPVALLGSVSFTNSNSAQMYMYEFDVNQNSFPSSTNVHHGGLFNHPVCPDSSTIKIPKITNTSYPVVSYEEGNESFVLNVKGFDLRFNLSESATKSYISRGVDEPGDEFNDGKAAYNIYGTGFLADGARVSSELSFDKFSGLYGGESYQMSGTVQPQPRPPRASDPLGNGSWKTKTLGFSMNQPWRRISPSVQTISAYVPSKNLNSHTSVLLNYSPVNKSLFWIDGGLNFSGGNCWKSLGHTYMHWVAPEADGKVKRIAGIEYFHQADGYPIIQVFAIDNQ